MLAHLLSDGNRHLTPSTAPAFCNNDAELAIFRGFLRCSNADAEMHPVAYGISRIRTKYVAFSNFDQLLFIITMLICICKIFFFLFKSCFQFLEARYLVCNALIILYLNIFKTRCIRLRTEYLAFVQSISRFGISINYYLLTMLIYICKILFFLFNSYFQFLEARYFVRNALIILYLTGF